MADPGPWHRRIARRPMLAAGVGLTLWMLGVALFAPLLARHDPLAPLPGGLQGGAPVGPGADHPLGTDAEGRDVLSRLIFGARISLTVGLGAMLLAVGIGLAVGVAAGYFGGAVDAALMRLTDVV